MRSFQSALLLILLLVAVSWEGESVVALSHNSKEWKIQDIATKLATENVVHDPDHLLTDVARASLETRITSSVVNVQDNVPVQSAVVILEKVR